MNEEKKISEHRKFNQSWWVLSTIYGDIYAAWNIKDKRYNDNNSPIILDIFPSDDFPVAYPSVWWTKHSAHDACLPRQAQEPVHI